MAVGDVEEEGDGEGGGLYTGTVEPEKRHSDMQNRGR